jgi:hypothetical protein
VEKASNEKCYITSKEDERKEANKNKGESLWNFRSSQHWVSWLWCYEMWRRVVWRKTPKSERYNYAAGAQQGEFCKTDDNIWRNLLTAPSGATICGDKHSNFLQQADNHSPNYMIPELRSSESLRSNSYRHFGTNYRSHLQLVKNKKKILTPEDGTDRLSRNVGKKLSPLAA